MQLWPGLLIETLDPVSEPDVEAAWSEEIERRIIEIDAGTVQLIPLEDVRAEFSASLNETASLKVVRLEAQLDPVLNTRSGATKGPISLRIYSLILL